MSDGDDDAAFKESSALMNGIGCIAQSENMMDTRLCGHNKYDGPVSIAEGSKHVLGLFVERKGLVIMKLTNRVVLKVS